MFKSQEFNSLKIVLIIIIVALVGYFVYTSISNRNLSQAGQVAGMGDESLLCNGPLHKIKVLSPNGLEVYKAGTQIPIKWKTCNIPSNTTVNISIVDEVGTVLLAHITTPNDSQQMIIAPATFSSASIYMVKMCEVANGSICDSSNLSFTISQAPYHAGCTSYAGYSNTTGVSCSPLEAGCSSYKYYSTTTGMECNTSGSLDSVCVAGGGYSGTTGAVCNPY